MKGDTFQSDEYLITDNKEKEAKKDRNIGLHFKKLEMIRDLKEKLDDKQNIESSEEHLIYGLTTFLFENKFNIRKGVIYLNEKEEVSLIFLDLASNNKTKIKLSKLSDIILGKKSGNFIVCDEKIKNKIKEENCLTMQMKDKKKFFDLIFNDKKDLNIFCLGVISIMEKNIKELNSLKRDIINLKQIWKQYISDNDKKHLNFEQFSKFLRTISFKWKKKTDEQIFMEIDVKKEGKINFKDFISFYEFLVTGEEFKEIFQKYSTDEDSKYISIRGLMDFMEKEQHLKISVNEIFKILNKFSKKTKKILESTSGLINTNADIENMEDNNNNENNLNENQDQRQLNIQENHINNNSINENIGNLDNNNENNDNIENNENIQNTGIINNNDNTNKKLNGKNTLNLNSNLKNPNNEYESLQHIYDNHSFGLLEGLEGKHENLYNSFCLSFREFVNFLIDKSYNSIYNYDLFPLHQDMNKPLNEYFIHSSHNTYLESHQMIGNSSIDMYMNVLKNGCRLVELDCWDGKNGPIITHWHFPVNKIELKECLIFIKDNAFRKSEYPVIFSIENHCNNFNQEMMQKYFIDVIGIENLFIINTNNPPLAYPSPNDLKRKFVIKCKRKRILLKKDEIEKNLQANNLNINNPNSNANNNSNELINMQRKNSLNKNSNIYFNENYSRSNTNKQNNIEEKENLDYNNNKDNLNNKEISNFNNFNNFNSNTNINGNNKEENNNKLNYNPDSFLLNNTKNYFKQVNNNNIQNNNNNSLENKNNSDYENNNNDKNIADKEREKITNSNSNTLENNNLNTNENENNKNIQWMLQKEEIIEEENSNNSKQLFEDNQENLLDSSNENVKIETDKFVSKEPNLICDIRENFMKNKNFISNFINFNTIENIGIKKSSSEVNLNNNNFNNINQYDQYEKNVLNTNQNNENFHSTYRSNPKKNQQKNIEKNEKNDKKLENKGSNPNTPNNIQNINKEKNKRNKDDLLLHPEDINKNLSLSSTDFTSKNNKNFNKKIHKIKNEINSIPNDNEYNLIKTGNNLNINNIINNEEDKDKDPLLQKKKISFEKEKIKKKKSNNLIEIERGNLKNINHTGILNNKLKEKDTDLLQIQITDEREKEKDKENNLNDNALTENLQISNKKEKDEIAVKIKYLPENKELKFKNLEVEIKDPPINLNNNLENDYENSVDNINSQLNKYDVYKIKTKKKEKKNNKNKSHLNKSLESEISTDPNKELQVSQPRNSGKVFDKLKVKYLINDTNNKDTNNNYNSAQKQNKNTSELLNNKEESINQGNINNTNNINNNNINNNLTNNNNNNNDNEVLTRMQEIRTMDEQKPSTIKIKTIEKMAKIVGMIGVKYKLKDFTGGLYLPWECVSISEPDFNRYAMNIEERIKIIKFCQKSFIKTYPDVVKRTNSTNQDAIMSWASGVQIAALNLQKTDDDMILINKIFFKLNGGSKSGYILKPEILRNPNCDLAVKKMTSKIAFKVKFKVLSGFHLHLCFPEKTKITGLYVEVSLRSAYNSEDNCKLITNTIENNYLHPIWVSKSVHFEVYDPDLSFIIIKIFSKKKSVVARSVIPVKFMNLGIRIVDLYDNYCSKFENSFLIVKCNKINL